MESEAFLKNIIDNVSQLEGALRGLDTKQISILEFISQCDQILTRKTKNT